MTDDSAATQILRYSIQKYSSKFEDQVEDHAQITSIIKFHKSITQSDRAENCKIRSSEH